jgi:hypothetical protein
VRYDEVRIELYPAEEGLFGARISFDDRESVAHTFALPQGIAAEAIYQEWIDALSSAGSVDLPTLEERRTQAGDRLFEILFEHTAGPLRERLLAFDQREPEGGLRLRLVTGNAVGPGNLNAAALLPVSHLPWELIHDRERGRLLARSRHVSIVRTVGAGDPPRPVEVEGRLKVLVVDAQPEGASPIGWKAEKERIKRALRKWEYAEVEFLHHASFEATCRRLDDGGFHIVHFIGHGGFDPNSGKNGQWFLLFEKDRKKDWVHADDIAARFGNAPNLKVAVLNACRTGEIDGKVGGDPLSGVATALSVGGVPVVVAMQIPVTDSMAIEFSDAFYSTLKTGLPIEMAVSAGRQAVRLSSPEWATPVVYLRGPSSDLLKFGGAFEASGPVGGPAIRSEEPPAPPELKLGIRSFVESKDYRLADWAVELDETTERFLPLEQHFEGRFIKDPALWNQRVLPQLDDFLLDAVRQKRPLALHLAAHASVAFASGYFFTTKEDAPLTLVQMTAGRPSRWSERDGTVPSGALWEELGDTPRDPLSADVAVAVEITRDTQDQVASYLTNQGIAVKHLLRARIFGGPGKVNVESGAHAFALAWELQKLLNRPPYDLPGRRLHLFISAPNGFVFFLGQVARSLQPIRLYEWDLERTKHCTYEPSLDLPAVTS